MTHLNHEKEKITFGFWLYLMSDCVLFATLFATYAVLRGQTFGGATPDDLLNLPFVFIETMLLLASSFVMGLGAVAARADKKNLVLAALGAALLLGAAFLGMEIHEFRNLLLEGNGPAASASLSAFFLLVGTHGLHVTLGSLWMIPVAVHVWLRGVERSSTKLACLAMFWHFLDIIWIFIFSFVYLITAAL